MTDIDLKTLTPDTSLPTTGYLFGADSQSVSTPSVYSTQTVATTLLGSTSLTGDTLTSSAPVLNLAQTWNSGATTFTGIKFNVVSDTSAAASLLMDLQVASASKFSVKKDGSVSTGVWQGTAVGVAYGGTGQTTLSTGDLIVGNGTNSSTRLGIGSTGQVLTVSGGTATWAAAASGSGTVTSVSVTTANGVSGTVATATTTPAISLSLGNITPTKVTVTEAVGSSALVLTGATQTSSFPVIDATQTWNNNAVTFTGVKLNVTNTNSAAGSLLMDLQVGGASKFKVDKDGNVYIVSSAGIFPVYSSTNVGLGNPNSLEVAIGTGLPSGRGLFLAATSLLGWSSVGGPANTADFFLSRKAAANLQLGAADAAAPVAQTLSVQSIVGGGGTPNLSAAAYPFKITGAQGTGQGAGGSIIFQTAPAAVSSGNGQNGLTDALTIDSVGSVRVVRALTVATLPGTPLVGMIARVTDALTPVIGATVNSGGAAYALVNYNGSNWTVIGV